MPGKWKVVEINLAGITQYIVYRPRKNNTPFRRSRKEYASGLLNNYDEAQKIADKLNEEEAENEG